MSEKDSAMRVAGRPKSIFDNQLYDKNQFGQSVR